MHTLFLKIWLALIASIFVVILALACFNFFDATGRTKPFDTSTGMECSWLDFSLSKVL